MPNHARALRWIVEQLNSLDVPFQAAGGLAARAFGATRALEDLDFYVPASRLADVCDALATWVVRPPGAYRDEWWDLTFLKLQYGDCEIELAGAEDARYFDRGSGDWHPAGIDFNTSVERSVLGTVVPMMPFDQLLAYKRRLARDIDLQDMREMLAAHGGTRTAEGC